MDCAHDRADEPFDMPAKVRPADRSVKQVDPILACPPLERLRLEFGSIVEVQQLRQATCRPGHLQFAIAKPEILWEHSLCKSQGNGQNRGSIE